MMHGALPCPPTSNTGGKFTRSRYVDGIGLDWLQGSFGFEKVYLIRQCLKAIGCEFSDAMHGRFGYVTCEVSPNGVFMAWTPGRSDACFAVPGAVLAELNGDQCWRLWKALADVGFKMTRLDVRFDDYDRVISPAEVHAACVKGHIAHYKRYVLHTSYSESACDGSTCEIGRRGANGGGRSYCVYDKLLESGDEALDCVRWELRIYGDRAVEAQNFLSGSPDAAAFVSRLGQLVGGNVGFFERTGDKNLDRLKHCDWWAKIVDKLGRAVVRPKRRERSLVKTMEALKKQYGTGCAAIKKAFEHVGFSFEEFVADLLDDGEKRLARVHHSRISEFVKKELGARCLSVC